MHKKLGDEKVHPDALEQMKSSPYNYADTRWAAYQNHDLGHRDCGHMQFMAVGPKNTFKEAPDKYPDSHLGIGWRYLHIGWVNLETGNITQD